MIRKTVRQLDFQLDVVYTHLRSISLDLTQTLQRMIQEQSPAPKTAEDVRAIVAQLRGNHDVQRWFVERMNTLFPHMERTAGVGVSCANHLFHLAALNHVKATRPPPQVRAVTDWWPSVYVNMLQLLFVHPEFVFGGKSSTGMSLAACVELTDRVLLDLLHKQVILEESALPTGEVVPLSSDTLTRLPDEATSVLSIVMPHEPPAPAPRRDVAAVAPAPPPPHPPRSTASVLEAAVHSGSTVAAPPVAAAAGPPAYIPVTLPRSMIMHNNRHRNVHPIPLHSPSPVK